jgi:heptosyltransferase II
MSLNKILVRAPNWIGDAVMAIPALQHLRRQYPHAEIAILARPWVAGLYSREAFCDELIPYEAPRGWSGLGAKWATVKDLRRRQFDCALLLQNAFEAAALAAAARIPLRIGYNRDGRGWLLTRPVPVPAVDDIPKHQRFYYLELLKRSQLVEGYNTTAGIALQGASLAATSGRALFAAADLRGPVVGVSPGAAYGGAKRWLPERFAETAVRIAKDLGATIALFGSEAEKTIAQTVQAQVSAAGVRTVNFCGAVPLSVFIEMAAACEVMLTNDSGPMHIASALGVPTVAIFGPTDEIATGPTGEHSLVIREPVECSPCLLRECPIDHRCMTKIRADRVAGQALALIGTVRGR